MSTGTTTLEQVRAAAHKALAAAGLDAVLLFGSRARGEAHEESDWDVVTVGRHARRRRAVAQQAFKGLDAVEIVPLTAKSIEKHRNRALRLESEVARDAKVLAGRWRRPEPLAERLKVTEKDMKKKLRKIRRCIEASMNACCSNESEGEEYDEKLVEYSQNAAEELARAVIATFGRRSKKTHDLKVLAEHLRGAPAAAHPLEARRTELADAIERLNGTEGIHLAGYLEHEVEPVERTKERIEDTLVLHTRWLVLWTEHDKTARKTVATGEAGIEIVERQVTSRAGFKTLRPASLREAFADWASAQRTLARRCALDLRAGARKTRNTTHDE